MLEKETHSPSSISCVDEELETQNSLLLGRGGSIQSNPPKTKPGLGGWLSVHGTSNGRT